MARITVKRGSEGPEHDPYAYTEITFYFTNSKRKPVTIHQGLGEWVRHGKRRYEGNGPFSEPYLIFERLTGISARKAERIPDVLFNRMMKRHTKEEQWAIMQCIEADEEMLRNAY
jgi:hypothetical protein